jgi:hypothetical protein
MARLLSVQGQVIDTKGQKALTGAIVQARQEGTELKQETDKSGMYVLTLTPGRWRISVQASGYQEPDPYLFNFSADVKGLDFALEEGCSITGMVITATDAKPASAVVVIAEATIAGKKVKKQALTDASGKYRFTALQPGSWTVQGELGECRTGKAMPVLGPDAGNQNLILSRKMTRTDWGSGIGFFVVLAFLLGGLIWGYLAAHQAHVSPAEPELIAFSGQVTQALDVANQAITKLQAGGQAEAGSEAAKAAETSMQLLRSSVASLKEIWNSISADILTVSLGQKGQVLILITRAETAAAGDDPQAAQLAITSLQGVLNNQHTIYLWSEPPLIYLEVLFWSMAGILISLLFSIGYYLRRKSFYAEGISMHISHLISVPVLALVVVFLLSMIKISVHIENSDVTLNVNDPRLLAAISFIIAVRPWDLIEFARDTGKTIFDKIKGRLAGGNDEQGKPAEK